MLYIALILGLIEGITEFIPVSSTGHLILFGDLLGFKGPEDKTFEIVVQLGAILAVCWLYRNKILSTVTGVVKSQPTDLRFSGGMLLAFLPAMVMGALFHEFIKSTLFNPASVSVVLILGGIVILIVERYRPVPRYHSMDELPLSLYLKIGLCQCLALVPGTSRSGATIIGALLLGVDRKVAAEFSFFLAIPTMFAATAFQIYASGCTLTFDGIELIIVGFLAAFISALCVVKVVIAYIAHRGFAPFAIYRILLGITMLALLY